MSGDHGHKDSQVHFGSIQLDLVFIKYVVLYSLIIASEYCDFKKNGSISSHILTVIKVTTSKYVKFVEFIVAFNL